MSNQEIIESAIGTFNACRTVAELAGIITAIPFAELDSAAVAQITDAYLARLADLSNPPAPTTPNEPASAPQGFDWSNPTVVRLIDRYTTLDRRATPQDAEQSRVVRQVADYYAANYTGSFDFMVSMRKAFDRWGTLTPAQASGTINCLLAEYRKRAAREARAESRADVAATLDSGKLPEMSKGYCSRCGAYESIDWLVDGRCKDSAACDWRIAQIARIARIKGNKPRADAPASEPAPTQITPACANGTYTIVLNERGEYRTIRLVGAEKMGKPEGVQIAQYLSGPDNEASYTGFAFVTGKQVGIWAKFKGDSVLATALRTLLTLDKEAQIDRGNAYAVASGNCFVCGRKLTVPASIHRGMGPKCAERY